MQSPQGSQDIPDLAGAAGQGESRLEEDSRSPESKAALRSGIAQSITRIGLIAALHATVTIIVLFSMQYLAWGPVQFRLSEALTVLPLFFEEAVVGLTLGTFISNLIYALSTTGPLSLLDVIFGPIATFLGALWTYRLRRRNILLALAGPIIVNALIVPAYLPFIFMALDIHEAVYSIPALGITAAGSFALMYVFGLAFVGLGQAVVVYALGLPLARILKRVSKTQDT